MFPYTYILFDLDGTLSCSAPGITRSLQYGLASIGIDASLPSLTRFIGPPLNVELSRVYHLPDSAIEKVISRFRDRYESKGIFETSLYPGVEKLLRDASAAGLILSVASSKPEPHVRRLMDHFHLTSCFSVISGSNIEDELANKSGADNKARVIAKTLDRLREKHPCVTPAKTLMIGDTVYDLRGAKENRLDALAVTYGYGNPADLAADHPAYLMDSAEEVRRFLLTGCLPDRSIREEA